MGFLMHTTFWIERQNVDYVGCSMVKIAQSQAVVRPFRFLIEEELVEP